MFNVVEVYSLAFLKFMFFLKHVVLDKLCPRTVNKDVKKKKALADVGNTCHSQTPMADISKRNVIPFKSIQSTNTPLKEIQNLEKFSAKKNPSFQKLSSVKKSSKDKRLVNSHMYDDEYYKCYCDGMFFFFFNLSMTMTTY